jgi:hypothetical protein
MPRQKQVSTAYFEHSEMPYRASHAPRLQFRLRTLFVLVTIVAVAIAYVAHEARIVGERREWLAAHPPIRISSYRPNTQVSVSFVRTWLGDIPVEQLLNVPECDVSAAHRIFPEAEISIVGNRVLLYPHGRR